ncbi:MAG: hypothetical protein IJO92_01710 [Clostridia bacterium]|nr:hypothetical protein [Clostridia bacterium]
MDRIIYTKRYPLKERIAEVQKSKNKIINQREWEQFIQAAIDFSERYEQGIEITENRPFLWIELFLTDHFFVDEGKKLLEMLFVNANRVDLAQRKNDVMINFHYYINE